MAARLQPNLVLMDLKMPGMPAPDAIRVIRARNPATQMLVLTSYAEDQQVQAVISAGALGYVLKDVAKAELLRAMNTVARGEPWLHAEAQRLLVNRMRKPAELDPLELLTDRERSVLKLLAAGQEQPRDRQVAAAHRRHGQRLRQQHPREAEAGRPHAGGAACGAPGPGSLTHRSGAAARVQAASQKEQALPALTPVRHQAVNRWRMEPADPAISKTTTTTSSSCDTAWRARGWNSSCMPSTSSEDYLSALEQQRFDVILSDSGLPGYDSRAALVAAQARSPNTPFVVVSAATTLPGSAAHVLKSNMSAAGEGHPARARERVVERPQRHSAQYLLGMQHLVDGGAAAFAGAQYRDVDRRDRPPRGPRAHAVRTAPRSCCATANHCYYADEDAISPLWKGQRFPMSACISGWAMLNRQAGGHRGHLRRPAHPARRLPRRRS